MLLVPTYLALSPLHGVGVFAAAPIARGTRMWERHPELDPIIPLETIQALPEVAQAFFRRYAYDSPQFPGGMVLGFDNSRFINHSTDPNTDNSGAVTVARRDIAKDEEITCDYGEFCTSFDLAD